MYESPSEAASVPSEQAVTPRRLLHPDVLEAVMCAMAETQGIVGMQRNLCAVVAGWNEDTTRTAALWDVKNANLLHQYALPDHLFIRAGRGDGNTDVLADWCQLLNVCAIILCSRV